jgi:tetratricopeptide (TPR) repeat protein
MWHQTGRVYEVAGQPDAAEDSYRKSLGIRVHLGDVAGQASTLAQLGNLYDDSLNRPEGAVGFYRQAADKFVEIGDAANEGRVRNNLGATLRKLHRLDDARKEIRGAIECKEPFGHAAEPWTAWAILAETETDAGNLTATAEAKGKAIATYLAYRRDGGENHFPDGRIALDVTRTLLAGYTTQAASLLERLAADSGAAELLPFIRALQAIVTGRRGLALAEAPELSYTMAAEILFLIETLENPPAA